MGICRVSLIVITNQAVNDGGLVDRVQWRVLKIRDEFQDGKNGTNGQNVKKGYTTPFISICFSGQK
jgi:hypothetical protein